MSKRRNPISGQESVSEILDLALAQFSSDQQHNPTVAIVIRNGAPHLAFEATLKDNLGEFVYLYRLDELAQLAFAECEAMYDAFSKSVRSVGTREILVRTLTLNTLNSMLRGLVCNQIVIAKETFDEALLITSSILFKVTAAAYKETDIGAEMEKACKDAVAKNLKETIKESSQRKRKYLISQLNAPPSLMFSAIGRPRGTKKKQSEIERDKADFIKKIVETYKALLSKDGKSPTKTKVARELAVGGLNPKTGIDSSLNSFNNKLKRLGIDYAAIVKKLHK
jgi:SpoVK/Ycf46/Vps4 family AAA+-type ATPase